MCDEINVRILNNSIKKLRKSENKASVRQRASKSPEATWHELCQRVSSRAITERGPSFKLVPVSHSSSSTHRYTWPFHFGRRPPRILYVLQRELTHFRAFSRGRLASASYCCPRIWQSFEQASLFLLSSRLISGVVALRDRVVIVALLPTTSQQQSFWFRLSLIPIFIHSRGPLFCT